MTAAKTKLKRILLYGLAGLTAFILVFLMAVFGVGLWQKKAKYPPSIDQTEARASLTLSGLAADRMGIALWQADGSGEEQKMAGHSLTTHRGEEKARYYLSSRDYKDIDGFSPGGLKASEPVVGFMRLTTALQKQGFGLSDLKITFPLCSLGKDIRGETWSYNDAKETRSVFCRGPILIQLAGEKMVSLPCEQLKMTLLYQPAGEASRVSFTLVSDGVLPEDISGSGSERVRDAARGFMADAAGSKVRLIVDNGRILDQTFSGRGRVDGLFGEVVSGRLEIFYRIEEGL